MRACTAVSISASIRRWAAGWDAVLAPTSTGTTSAAITDWHAAKSPGCATVQTDNNCVIIMRLKDAFDNAVASANVAYNSTVTRCAKNVTSVTLQRAAPGELATVNWRVDDVHSK